MPRIAGQMASGKGRSSGSRQVMATPHKQSPMKLSMNDDRGEKVARLQSRQALQEIQMNEIRAAASPMRKMNAASSKRNDRDVSSSPRTPRSQAELRRKGGRESNVRDSLNVVGGSAVTPMKRVPILANFEEWMKMATDNKINAANSWNFALIDYFHDMSLLREGDGVNFQKASCTLDGCVKIYTSRVDSVATETGRLLSGLADNADGKGKKGSRPNEEDGEGEDGEEGEDGDEDGEDGTSKKRQKKKPARSHEATLAPSFASLQLKKLELEFAVDPLFKKASADFDEGGAKGLLLNHLSIDSDGRIVFDSSDDAVESTPDPEPVAGEEHERNENVEHKTVIQKEESEKDSEEVDLAALAAKFFPDLSILDSQDICPSMKTFTLGDPNSDLSAQLLKAPDDWRQMGKDKPDTSTALPPLDPSIRLAEQTGIFLDGTDAMGFDDDDDGALGGFDMPDGVGFGEGGEAWAKDAALEPMMNVVHADDGGPLDDNLIDGANPGEYALSLQHRFREDAERESILAYFDKAFNSRVKGKNAFMTLENWRIQKIQRQNEPAAPTRQRKEKEPFEIDFSGPMSDSLKALLAAPPVSNSTISLPKTQWKTKGANLLDKDDELVDARKLMRLWIKPKCRVGKRKGGEMKVIDEGFGARSQHISNPTDHDEDEGDAPKGDYDANFFADDEPALPFDVPLPIDDDDDDGIGGLDDGGQTFIDAREMLSPSPEGRHEDLANGQLQSQPFDSQFPHMNASSQTELLPGSFGSQLVTQAGRRMRPEYVNYARTAKKVDVRRLKENMWKGMSDTLMKSININTGHAAPMTPAPSVPDLVDGDGDTDMMEVDEIPDPITPPTTDLLSMKDGFASELKFTDMIGGLKRVYPEQQMKDISTSYCFICLLHLANEKGLVLEGGREDGTMGEIVVRRDLSVGEGYEGE